MAKVTFDFDSDGYINVRGERYSALEIVNDAGNTALDWMLAQDNEELINIANSWGLTPEKDDKTGAKKQEDTVDDPENEGNVDEAVDKSDTGGGLSNEEVTSIQERLNNLFGYKMKNNVVQKDSKGNPIIANQKAAIKITAGVEPKIQADGTVDIPGDVTINLVSDSKSMKSVDNGKFTIKFGKIDGNFICRGVKLSSLEGGPKFVKGTFDCGKNDLTSLVGAPEEVNIFIADQNPKLTLLTGGPKKINGISDPTKDQRTDIYRVDSCGLTSLDGNGITLFGPGGFNCANNKITSLTGLSTISSVGVTKFNCSKNNLSSLNGIPKPRKDAKSGKPGDFDISHNLSVTTFPSALADFEVNDFKANGLSLTSLSFAPKQVYGNFECTDNKGSTKITNQSIGKDRFKPTGFEEVAGNRIVKIDGEFITSEGLWKDKTYDSNTVYVKPTENVTSGGPEDIKATVSGGIVTINNPEYTAGTDKKGNIIKRSGKVYLQVISSFSIGHADILPVMENGVHATGTAEGTALKYDFVAGTVGSGFGYLDSKNEYDGKYGIPVDFQKATGGKIKNRWVDRGYKNFINWSLYELRRTGWGSAQPTGNFIKNGKYYGAKPNKKGNINAAIINGKPDIVYGNGLFSNGLTPKPGVSIAAGGSRTIIQNGANTNLNDNDYRGYPFIGKVTIGGKNQFFAGASGVGPTPKMVGDCILGYFNKQGSKVSICAIGDGGGSTAFVVNGQTVTGGGRTFPILIYW